MCHFAPIPAGKHHARNAKFNRKGTPRWVPVSNATLDKDTLTKAPGTARMTISKSTVTFFGMGVWVMCCLSDLRDHIYMQKFFCIFMQKLLLMQKLPPFIYPYIYVKLDSAYSCKLPEYIHSFIHSFKNWLYISIMLTACIYSRKNWIRILMWKLPPNINCKLPEYINSKTDQLKLKYIDANLLPEYIH